jgi:hypothetical protein
MYSLLQKRLDPDLSSSVVEPHWFHLPYPDPAFCILMRIRIRILGAKPMRILVELKSQKVKFFHENILKVGNRA